MSCRFAGRDAIIVTAAARAVHRIVIDARNRIPLPTAAMTRFAIGIRIDVIRRFPRCRNHAALGMTTRAIARRTFELTAYVTALASQSRVRTIERKSGFEMIEIGSVRRTRGAHETKNQRKPSQHACYRWAIFYLFAVHRGDSSLIIFNAADLPV